MNPESRRIKKLLYLDTLIKINAFCREAVAEVLCGVYFTADFFGKENNPPINSTASFPARPVDEPRSDYGWSNIRTGEIKFSILSVGYQRDGMVILLLYSLTGIGMTHSR